jgi:hypothetical protein
LVPSPRLQLASPERARALLDGRDLLIAARARREPGGPDGRNAFRVSAVARFLGVRSAAHGDVAARRSTAERSGDGSIREAFMRRRTQAFAISVVLTIAGGDASAQSIGPDVIVGDLMDTANYGSSLGVYAYAIGTYSCNIGNATLQWVASTNQHPVIGQNLYRYFPGSASAGQWGRFEQVGMSWLKHGFTALALDLCAPCQNPGSGSLLGIGCADPYVASLNGTQSGLGPRWQVDPFTGAYTYPPPAPTGNALLKGRLQVASGDFSTTTYPGATFYAEGQYVTADDAASGNHFNNASWRPVNVAATTNNLTVTSYTRRMQPAIFAWKEADPLVAIQTIDVPGEGRFYVGYRATSLGGGLFHHEYAVFNLNSDRAAESFTIALPPGVSASNLGFHDVSYHSGEPWVGTDWTSTHVPGTSIGWACASQAVDPNANALRWGTLYNFRFDAPAAYLPDATIGLWKPGIPATVAATICPAPNATQTSTPAVYALQFPAYDFVATAGVAGAQAGPSGNDSVLTVALPFPFFFYDRWLTQITISTNGYLCAPEQNGTLWQNASIPSANAPNDMIAAYWDDLDTSGGSITYLTSGVAPNRRFVVHWNNVKRFGTTQLENHQAILDETTNAITLTCVSTQGGGVSATRGIEHRSGTLGSQLSFNQANSVSGGTSRRYAITVNPVVPKSAELVFTGTGAGASYLNWRIVSEPNRPISLLADPVLGPLNLGLLGVVDIALSPYMLPLADATGVWAPIDPAAVTGPCNTYLKTIQVPGQGIPPGLTIYFQGVVWSPTAPNGFAHITTLAQLNT